MNWAVFVYGFFGTIGTLLFAILLAVGLGRLQDRLGFNKAFAIFCIGAALFLAALLGLML